MRSVVSIIDRMKQVTGSSTDAELIGYLQLKSVGAISTWKSRDRIPYPECDFISQKENVDLGWLITGKQAEASTSSNSVQGQVVEKKENDLIHIPEYDVCLSAGGGTYPLEHALAIGERSFDSIWLSKKGLKPKDLALVRVQGDSMEPLLKDKDIVMVDTSKTVPSEAMPFAIRFGQDLFIKTVQRLGNGNIALISRNKDYNDIVIDKNNPPEEFNIIGAVVWHAHSWV